MRGHTSLCLHLLECGLHRGPACSHTHRCEAQTPGSVGREIMVTILLRVGTALGWSFEHIVRNTLLCAGQAPARFAILCGL